MCQTHCVPGLASPPVTPADTGKPRRGFPFYPESGGRKAYCESIRKEALERAGGQCERCGANGRLILHHKTYEHLGRESANDFRALCPACHKQIHTLTKFRRPVWLEAYTPLCRQAHADRLWLADEFQDELETLNAQSLENAILHVLSIAATQPLCVADDDIVAAANMEATAT